MSALTEFRVLPIGDHTVYLSDSGSAAAPSVLLLHGIMMDRSVWTELIEVLSTEFRVIAVDLRGYGRSSAASPEISFEDHAADLAAICEMLQLREVQLVGWSMGGAIAQVAAVTYPELWSRIVLVDSTPQLIADADFTAAVAPEAGAQLGQLLAEDFTAGCAAFTGLISPENTEVAARLSEIATRTDPQVALAAFASSAARKLQEYAPKITTPTSIICGENDMVCPLGASEYLAEMIAGAVTPVQVIADAGHAPFLTRPEVFHPLIARILRS